MEGNEDDLQLSGLGDWVRSVTCYALGTGEERLGWGNEQFCCERGKFEASMGLV